MSLICALFGHRYHPNDIEKVVELAPDYTDEGGPPSLTGIALRCNRCGQRVVYVTRWDTPRRVNLRAAEDIDHSFHLLDRPELLMRFDAAGYDVGLLARWRDAGSNARFH